MIVVRKRVFETGNVSRAKTQFPGSSQEVDSIRVALAKTFYEVARAIRATVINDQHVEVGGQPKNLADYMADVLSLVVRGDDDERQRRLHPVSRWREKG